jgi:hypothetical protein
MIDPRHDNTAAALELLTAGKSSSPTSARTTYRSSIAIDAFLRAAGAV